MNHHLQLSVLFNPFAPNARYLYPLKTSENLRCSDVFRVKRKGVLGTNGLICENEMYRI